MRKAKPLKLLLVMFSLCAVLFFVLSGCAETIKGFQRDLDGLKNSNDWFKEHYW